MTMNEKKYILLKTVFNGDNFGSSLQAYALKCYLEEMFSTECVVVENREKGFRALWNTVKRKFTNLFKSFLSKRLFVDVWHKRFSKNTTVCKYGSGISKRFEEFTSKYICPEYYSYSDLKKMALSDNCLRSVCGSDQVWNPTGTTLSRMNFLMFSPREKNVSYAASVGAAEIPYYNFCSFRKKINNIRWISVREQEAKALLEKNFDINAVVCVDPVALVGRDFWLSRIEKHFDGEFVFCYFLNQPSENAIEEIHRCSESGFEIKILSRVNIAVQGENITVLNDVTPFDFPALINDAECVLTDSFHGMMFSLVLRKSFMIYERDYQTSVPQNGRIVSLLERLDIIDRFVKNDSAGPTTVNALDHERIEAVMQDMVQSSKAFLTEAIPYERC